MCACERAIAAAWRCRASFSAADKVELPAEVTLMAGIVRATCYAPVTGGGANT
jgi:hypothetical protein